MPQDLKVEVSFVGAPPAMRLERASGVSPVEIDRAVLRCVVGGSFHPFLEALSGHEDFSLQSMPVAPPTQFAASIKDTSLEDR